MTGKGAAATRIFALGLLAAVGSGLSGCGTIDNALFGGSTEEAATAPAPATANEQTTPAPAQSAEAPAGEAPAGEAPAGEAPSAPVAAAAGPPPVAAAPITPASASPPSATAEFAPIAIAPGADTGTSVSHTIATLRTNLESLESKLAANAQRFAELRSTGAQNAAAYQNATGSISARLAQGTTRGNPELIGEWNTAQGALDSLSANINALGQLASGLSTDSASVHEEYEGIQGTLDASGAIDEDHRQLTVLSDEAGETMVIIDRMFREVKQALARETAYVAGERGNLTTLAAAIKSGEYSPLVPARSASAAPATSVAADSAGAPIVTIKFNRSRVNYERVLYSALSQALASRPSASFNVVAVSPTRGTETAVQLAQTNAQHHAQDVMHTMGEMGVPATRMQVASSTDPDISASEVRVYMR